MNAQALKTLSAPAAATSEPDPVAAIAANLRDQLIAQQYDQLAIGSEGNHSIYLLLPAGSCPTQQQAAAERLVADGHAIGHRYIGGSSPVILAVAA